MDPLGFRARELRRGRRVAHARGRRPHRRVGSAVRRHRGGRRGHAAAGAAAPAGCVRLDDDREAAHVRAWPRPRRPRHACASPHRARVRTQQLSFLLARPRHRRTACPSRCAKDHRPPKRPPTTDQTTSTDRHVHHQALTARRTFLRGVGATVALPFLEAMVPAFNASRRGVGTALRRGLRAQRRDCRRVDAEDARPGLRADADSASRSTRSRTRWSSSAI